MVERRATFYCEGISTEMRYVVLIDQAQIFDQPVYRRCWDAVDEVDTDLWDIGAEDRIQSTMNLACIVLAAEILQVLIAKRLYTKANAIDPVRMP